MFTQAPSQVVPGCSHSFGGKTKAGGKAENPARAGRRHIHLIVIIADNQSAAIPSQLRLLARSQANQEIISAVSHKIDPLPPQLVLNFSLLGRAP